MTVAYPRGMAADAEVDLIREILAGQRNLFADLIAPHLAPLARAVERSVRQPQDVEDIVQQAAMKAFHHLNQFRKEASFRTWLVRIAINEVRQWRRNATTSRFLQFDEPETEVSIPDERESPLRHYQRREAAATLREVLAGLPEKYRSVIILRELQQLSLIEVAHRLQLTVPAVKTRQLRARLRMQRLLKEAGRSHSSNRVRR